MDIQKLIEAEGRKAFLEGESRESCLYYGQECQFWLRGWDACKVEHEAQKAQDSSQ